jgi:uncharacterized protein (TIGR02099 family)
MTPMPKAHKAKQRNRFKVRQLLHFAHACTRSRRLRRVSHGAAHFAFQLTSALLVLLVLAYTLGHLWLPHLVERKSEFSEYLSRHSGYPVHMETLDPYWDGLNPGVRIGGFKVYTPDTGRLAIQLDEVRLTLSWLPLLTGKVSVNSLVLVQPSLTVERMPDRRIRVSGLEPLEAGPAPVARDAGFMGWLVQQTELAIEDGELLWIDHVAGEAPLHLTVVNVLLHNSGDHHRLEFNAVFPRTLCNDCQFVADVIGNPVAGEPWRGEIYLQADGVDTRHLPLIAHQLLPAGLDGRVSAQLLSEWRYGVPVSVRGHVEGAALQLPLPGRSPMAVQAASADLTWSSSNDSQRWRLDLTNLKLGLAGRPWSAGALRLEHREDQSELYVRHVNLDDISAFVAELPEESNAPRWLRVAKPRGAVDDVQVRLEGDPAAPTGYAVEAHVKGLKLQAYDKFPGLSGVDARLAFDQTGGSATMTSETGRVDLPRLFPRPLTYRKAAARLTWRRSDTQWRLDGSNLYLTGDDGTVRGGFEARIPLDTAQSPLLKMRLDFTGLNGARAANFYPVFLHAPVRDWLSHAVVSGTVTSGHAIFSGAVREFPFRAGNGTFEVQAHVTNGVFAYLPGWPPIDHIDADLRFYGPGLSVTGQRGRIRGLDVAKVQVNIDDLHPPDGAQVHATAEVKGPLDDTLAVLYAGHHATVVRYVPVGLRGRGDGTLALALTVPAADPHATHWTAWYRCDNNDLLLPQRAIEIQGIQGDLRLSEAGATGGSLRATLFGTPLLVDISTGPATLPATRPDVRVSVRGQLNHLAIDHLLGTAVSGYLHGPVPWSLDTHFADTASSTLSMDLKDLTVGLPSPLGKSAGTPLTLDVRAATSGTDAQQLHVRLGSLAEGRLLFRRTPQGVWALTRGRVGVGEANPVLPDNDGLQLGLRTSVLDADRWSDVLRHVAGASRDPGLPDVLTRVTGDVGALRWLGRDLGQFNVDMARSPQGWSGQLHGASIHGSALISTPAACQGAGCVRAPGAAHNTVALNLENLSLPARTDGDATASVPPDPQSLPELHLKSKSLVVAGHAFGSLDFTALPQDGGWKIQRLNLAQPLLQVEASGAWQVTPAGGQSTRMDVHLTSPDAGAMLNRLGFVDEIAEGNAEITSSWSWDGAPTQFELARLNGEASLVASKGRLIQVNQGAGRLLGVIDARALSRYLTLDFSSLFGKGFVFDSIRGQFTVEQGNAYTRTFSIKGTSADIGLTGRIGLAARDLDLDIRVMPRFKGELAVTGALLATPVVGVAMLAAQELFKKPLAEGTHLSYTVKGAWADPQVVRVQKQASDAPFSEN